MADKNGTHSEFHARMHKGRYEHPWKCDQPPNVYLWWQLQAYRLKKVFTSQSSHSDLPALQNINDLDRELPYHSLSDAEREQLKKSPTCGIRLMWIGHATCLVQMEGLTILTDPMFSSHAFPVKISSDFKRYRDVPEHCTVDNLPAVDVVIISHDHYDHLDVQSVRDLNRRFGKHLTWLVPRGLGGWMKTTGCDNVVELEWWEEHVIPSSGVRFALTPAQHWCQRGVRDRNKVLWGSWSVIGQRLKFFFAGDTGYPETAAIFEEIRKRYGTFDCSAIPIGAYEPRWAMKMQHVSPTEAVKIHKDLGSKNSVGIHWGTFDMAYEHILQPRKDLKEALAAEGIPPEQFITLRHGETILFSSQSKQ